MGLIASLIQIIGDGSLGIAIAIGYFIYALLEHPEEQDKIYKELDEVIGQDSEPILDDKNKLPYTTAFMHEVQRTSDFFTLFPSYECTKEITINGYKIPKGAATVINFWSCHRDPKVFENPNEFKPSRFLVKSGESKPEFPIMFGVGRKSCIGESFVMMETFLFLSRIVKNFRLTYTRPSDKVSFLNGSMEVVYIQEKLTIRKD